MSDKRICYACGDPAPRLVFNNLPVCLECYNELRHGRIENQNVNFFGGHAATKDDESPWQQNAIKEMEGDR